MRITFNTKTVLTSAILISVLSVAAAFQLPDRNQKPEAEIQTVSITAQRMSAEQKLAFDQENSPTQTVIIRAKRLSNAQKIAMTLQDQALQAVTVSKKSPIQSNG